MCSVRGFDREAIDYLLYEHRLHSLTRFLIGIYFTHARVAQVRAPADPLSLDGYRLQLCECRLVNQCCDRRIDTCYVKRGPEPPVSDRLGEALVALNGEGFVRMTVNAGNFKQEVCHCCSCCCFPIIAHNAYGGGLLLPSGSLPRRDEDACTGCLKCSAACPFNAVGDDLKFDEGRCLGCGLCERLCPARAIRMVRVKEVRGRRPSKLFSQIFLNAFNLYFAAISPPREH